MDHVLVQQVEWMGNDDVICICKVAVAETTPPPRPFSHVEGAACGSWNQGLELGLEALLCCDDGCSLPIGSRPTS